MTDMLDIEREMEVQRDLVSGVAAGGSTIDSGGKMEVQRWIETCKGRAFYLETPVFDIEEVAHALSNVCRYAGHCRRFYSVAEHSVLVADIMEVLGFGNPMEGLLHDGTESVLADIAAPWKALMPDYKRIESELDRALRKQFELPERISVGCKHADWIALAYEAEQLIPSQGRDWLMPDGVREDMQLFKRQVWNGFIGERPNDAEAMFLKRFERLGGRNG